MEWWKVFFWIRKVVFAFIAIISFLWAIVLSVYIAREWPHFVLLQKILLLVIIGINMFTSVLLYLMIVVVFKMWLDLARIFFLLLLHTGTAVMLTLYGRDFSCAIFESTQSCKDVNLSFMIASWVVAGLDLTYMTYLLIMVSVPRPLPRITPNLLLDSYPDKQRSSTVSVISTTGLLRQDTVKSNYSSTDLERSESRTVPKSHFLANVSPVSAPATRSVSYVRNGRKYGAMGMPGSPPPASRITSRSASIRTVSTAVSNIPPSLRSTFTGGMEQYRQVSTPIPPKPLPLPNPFFDPESRHGTPDSVYSTLPYNAKPMSVETTEFGLERYQPLIPAPISPGQGYVGYRPYADAAAMTPSSLYSTPTLGGVGPYYLQADPYAMPGIRSAGEPLRTHTTTPHSIHSVTPSMHHTEAADAMHHPLQHPVGVHTRGNSDPIYRPYTASPRLHRQMHTDEPLPNPFPPLVSRNDVRRFGSMSGPSGVPYHVGQGGTYFSPEHDARNAAYLVNAMGRTPPRAEAVAPDPTQWKQLVLVAAKGRTL